MELLPDGSRGQQICKSWSRSPLCAVDSVASGEGFTDSAHLRNIWGTPENILSFILSVNGVRDFISGFISRLEMLAMSAPSLTPEEVLGKLCLAGPGDPHTV